MIVFASGDPEKDFFEQNPELKYITEFAKLIEEEGKQKASRIMWCIYMIEDPKSSIFRLPRNQKVQEIIANYYKDYDETKYDKLSRLYGQYCMEKEEYLYSIQIEKFDQLTTHLKDLSISNEKDFGKYIRIMEKLPKVWEALEKVRTKMIDKQNKSELRGGAQRSSREKRA